MALIQFEDDPWIIKHDTCENLYRDIQSQLVTWSYENRTSDLYGQLSVNIRGKLNKFQSNIEQLTEQLAKIIREQLITDAESERRARQIEVLRSKHSQLKAQFHNGIQSSYSQNNVFQADEARQQLLGNTSGNSRAKESGDYKSVDWGTGSDDEELLDTNHVDVESARKTRSEMIKDQDRGLDELSKIIARQRNIAENIGSEVALHNDIIDDLGEHVDRTDARIQNETGQIRGIRTKDATCGYWTVIILLLIAIVIIAII